MTVEIGGQFQFQKSQVKFNIVDGLFEKVIELDNTDEGKKH